MREIVLDTETTGLDPQGRRPADRDRLHRAGQPHPDRPRVSPLHQSRARRAGGGPGGARISTAFLMDKPLFAEVADEFLAFIARGRARHPQRGVRRRLSQRRAGPAVARRDPHGPGDVHAAACAPPASGRTQQPRCAVQALRHRQSKRTKHGALMDSLLLAEVYIELLGERQAAFVDFAAESARRSAPSWRRLQRGRAAPAPGAAAVAADAPQMRGSARGVRRDAGREGIWRRYLASQHRAVTRQSTKTRVSSSSWLRLRPAAAQLLLAAHVERGEIERVEQQRREAAFARHVGDDAAHEREEDRRAIDEQERLERLLGNVLDAEQAGVDELELIDLAMLVGRLRVEVDGALVELRADALAPTLIDSCRFGWSPGSFSSFSMFGFSNDRSLMYCATTFTCTGGGIVCAAASGFVGFPLPLPVLAIECVP